MTRPPPARILVASCCLALAALALIVWSLLDPRPLPVIVAMTVGQALGTLSFATFAIVVLADLRAHYQRVAAGETGSANERE